MRYKIFLFCFLFLAFTKQFSAQTYPINVTTQLIGGFTGYMEDYTSPVNEQLRILVTQYDLTKPTYNVHFKVRIEGPNILIESKANYYSELFFVDPGVPLQISGNDLAGLLSAENLNFSGISKNTYQTKTLPEGFYSFCFTAYDGTSVSKAQVSNASCAMSYFSKSDPPFLNLPLCGSELKPTDPQQITFSWTPMHMGSINAFNTVDYLFELFEVRPAGQNINNIVQTSVPVFSTTTNLTMLNYGIAETPLIPGMQYVWRVRAVESSGKESFKNNGFSQVCSFNYGSKYDGIDVKIKLNAIGLLPEVVKAYWDTLDIYNNYHLFISKVNGNGTWREFKTKKGEQYINIVEPECTYKLYVIGDLDEGGQGKASDTVLVTTPAVKKIVCNDLPPPPPPENGDPLTTASVGMMWSIGQFRMEVLTLENTASPNGRYTGTGKIELLPGYMIAHYFENIRMNNLMQMTHGVVMAESTGMDNWREKKRNAEQGGDDTGDEVTGAVTTDAIISGTVTDIKVTNNNDSTATVTISTSEGDKTFENQSLPFTVIDGEGNIFFADKDGTAGKAAKSNYLPPLNTKQLDTLSSIGLATFTANSNQNYGFDSFQDIFAGKSIVEKEYQVLSSKFEVLSTKNQQPTTSNYRVPQKSIKASGYDKVNVSITLNDKNLNADSVVFVSSKGTQFLKLNVNSSTLSGNTQPITNNSSTYNFALALVGGPADDAQNIYALYKNGSTLKSIGKIKVAGYGLQKKTIVLVPVEKVQGIKYNVPSVAEIQKQLNNIYKSACIEYSVKIDSAFTTSALGADGTLDVTGSGLFSQYTEEMKALNKAYSQQRTIDKKNIYLFVLPAATDASVVGDMPRGKQFGYLFADALKNDLQAWTNTIAHEAAHGAGKLKHTFDADINLPEKTTSNLMDYNNGTNLYKYQWDQLQDPGELTALFDEDEDAMMVADCKQMDFTGKYFIALNGFPFKFTNEMKFGKPSEYTTGTVGSFIVDNKEYKASGFAAGDAPFYGYGFSGSYYNGLKYEKNASEFYIITKKGSKIKIYKQKNYSVQSDYSEFKLAPTADLNDMYIESLTDNELVCSCDYYPGIKTNNTLVQLAPRIKNKKPKGTTYVYDNGQLLIIKPDGTHDLINYSATQLADLKLKIKDGELPDDFAVFFEIKNKKYTVNIGYNKNIVPKFGNGKQTLDDCAKTIETRVNKYLETVTDIANIEKASSDYVIAEDNPINIPESSAFDKIVEIVHAGKEIIVNAQLPKRVWDSNDKDYNTAIVNVPATVAGIGDGVIEELKDVPVLVAYGADILLSKDTRDKLTESLKNLTWNKIKDGVKDAAKDWANTYAKMDDAAFHQGGKDAVLIYTGVAGLVAVKKAVDDVGGIASQTDEIADEVEKKAIQGAGSLVSRLDNALFSVLKGKVNQLDNVLNPQFLDDFANASDDVLKKLQDDNLFDVWKNDIRSTDITELTLYKSKGSLRNDYLQTIDGLKQEAQTLLSQNKLKVEVAETMCNRRRQITTDFKGATPDDLLEWIFKFNDKRYTSLGYGDKWGQTWEGAKKHHQSKGLSGEAMYDAIIKGSSTGLGTKEQLGIALKKTLDDLSTNDFNRFKKTLEKYRMWPQ